MEGSLYYAFMDESGTVGVSGTQFLVLAVTALSNPRDLEKPIRRGFHRALKTIGSDTVNEVKASDLDTQTICDLLSAISEQDITIMATIVDQRVIQMPPNDMEEIYRQAAAWTVRQLAQKFSHLNLSIDKRYTNRHLRFLLEIAIRLEIESIPRQNIIILQENSVLRRELQAADVVAWAFFQKYEHADERYYDIIREKIAVETLIQQKDWRPRRRKR